MQLLRRQQKDWLKQLVGEYLDGQVKTEGNNNKPAIELAREYSR